MISDNDTLTRELASLREEQVRCLAQVHTAVAGLEATPSPWRARSLARVAQNYVEASLSVAQAERRLAFWEDDPALFRQLVDQA